MDDLPIEIELEPVKRLLLQESVVLIDCREQDEYELARIEGAILMPMSQWLSLTEQLAELEEKHVVVHCHHGVRSLRVANWLRENGFPHSQSMRGGIDAWSLEIDSSVPGY